jgi:hypothetical protein
MAAMNSSAAVAGCGEPSAQAADAIKQAARIEQRRAADLGMPHLNATIAEMPSNTGKCTEGL